MGSLETPALVLRVSDLGESDRIVRLLSPSGGRLAAVAKGAKRSRRRFLGTLDLLNLLHVNLAPRPRSALARLEQARLVHAFPGLRAHAARFALACYLVELIDRLAPEGGARADARAVYRFLVAALVRLEGNDPDPRLRTFLELRALATLGLRPELRVCVRCGGALRGAREIGFHVAEGGPVCSACTAAGDVLLRVHAGTLRSLDQGLRLPLDRLERLSLRGVAGDEALGLVRRFSRFHVGLELRSEPFLDLVLAAGPRSQPSSARDDRPARTSRGRVDAR